MNHTGEMGQTRFMPQEQPPIFHLLPNDDFWMLLGAMPVGGILLDADHRIKYWNPLATRTLGYAPSDMLGKRVTETIFVNEASHQFAQIARGIQEFQTLSSVLESQGKDGRSHLINWRFIRLNGGTHDLLALIENEADHSKNDSNRHHRDRLHALRTIDTAISGGIDFQVTLSILLQQMMSQLKMDAAVVLVYEASTNTLKYAAGRGLRTNALLDTNLRIGEGYAGMAALQKKVIQVPHLQYQNGDSLHPAGFSEEGFASYYCVPLIAKGVVKGVMESFHRTPFHADREWLDFFETLGGQAAIAIDNAMLFNDLQRSNLELMLAYDSTLEGWSKALDMRDRDTEGHTRRVTEMTERLALAFRIKDADRIHIRRGAILHDIGKMGIPDSILLKDGPLSDEEWKIMRQHPDLAVDMLSSIGYLRPALDIPHCHHEKWDGSGYPRGLRGEQIPIAARIFAVVDVFDALTSDRPYRRAWSVEDALNYIQAEAGKHFDPGVVSIFMQVVAKDGAGIIKKSSQ
jgi:PAS domain S-box-containing protein/putative nucleotidyltransferase with HDIG domain